MGRFLNKLNSSLHIKNMGSKCKNLAFLTEYGFSVPTAYGLTFEAYKIFASDLYLKIKKIIKKHDYAKASVLIKDIIMSQNMPDVVYQEIYELSEMYAQEDIFAVRSSGVVSDNKKEIEEDSKNRSLAGQYESYLSVLLAQIDNAVKLCWASLFNERSLHVFSAKTNISFLDSRMSVVIQEMIVPDASAVVMTMDPVFSHNEVAMEVTYGACEALVSGKVTGDLITVDRDTKHIVVKELGEKEHRVVYQNFNILNKGRYFLHKNSFEERNKFAITEILIEKIVETALLIEDKFGFPQDIELVIKDNEIFIVQTRSITTISNS